MAAATDDIFFSTINENIKNIIKQIQSKLGRTNQVRREEAKKIIKKLDEIQDSINKLAINQANTVKVERNAATNIFEATPDGTYRNKASTDDARYTDTTGANINDFIKQADYVDNAGNIALTHNAQSINIENIDDETAQTLPTIKQYDELKLDTDGLAKLNLRLQNCQYLEILYLVKHEELMKTFAFLLNLYEKYQYAINLLLFILKNLLDHKCPEPEWYEPEEYEQPKIKLPKVLISNIKNLLKDQKQVQNIVAEMKTKLDTDANTQSLRTLLTQTTEPTPDRLRTQNQAGLDNQVNPNSP